MQHNANLSKPILRNTQQVQQNLNHNLMIPHEFCEWLPLGPKNGQHFCGIWSISSQVPPQAFSSNTSTSSSQNRVRTMRCDEMCVTFLLGSAANPFGRCVTLCHAPITKAKRSATSLGCAKGFSERVVVYRRRMSTSLPCT